LNLFVVIYSGVTVWHCKTHDVVNIYKLNFIKPNEEVIIR